MSTAEEIESAAAALHAMTAPELIEQRSVENPALAVSPALLDGLWGYGPTRSGVQEIQVSSVCIEAGVPSTTILRWLTRLELEGLLYRTSDNVDGRRRFVRLTEAGVAMMDRLLETLNLGE